VNFDGEALFQGVNSSGHAGLRVTNGTGGGMRELTGMTGADASGLAPNSLTVLNGEALFKVGLWTTNGTSAGTSELTDIRGAPTAGSGLNPTDSL
jgi:ELWxxDGT repeat protein